jgi:glucosamine--fructose-6-phosphate aminotransferase (isomerizing)
MSSAMRATMARQPEELRRLLADREPAARAAELLAGRRVLLAGTGTSWHAANHGAWMLGAAGVEAWAIQPMDAAVGGVRPRARAGPASGVHLPASGARGGDADALILLSHTGIKRYSAALRESARAAGVPTLAIGGIDRPGVDLPTVERERSSAYTASHLGALLRLAQLASELGAELGPLDEVPDAVAAALARPSRGVEPPARLLEYVGAGANAWTAEEGALKVRETARLASDGLMVEQFLHGPAVALDTRDALVCLDGGGPGAERVEDVAEVVEAGGARVHRVVARELGEQLSIFPLTVAVQRIALELAEALGTDPDAFGYDVPGRRAAWERLTL